MLSSGGAPCQLETRSGASIASRSLRSCPLNTSAIRRRTSASLCSAPIPPLLTAAPPPTAAPDVTAAAPRRSQALVELHRIAVLVLDDGREDASRSGRFAVRDRVRLGRADDRAK